ncbi:MAG: hypothetical protein GX481_08745, partial [Atopobium sp.]|nr:hypothetical protein [Atopobium sp.]
MKKVMICSKCGKAYLNEESGVRFCPDDGGALESTGLDEAQWNSMSPEAQANAISAIMNPVNNSQNITDALKTAGSALGNAARMTGEQIKNSQYAKSISDSLHEGSKNDSFEFQPYKNVGESLCKVSNTLCMIGFVVSVIVGLLLIINNPLSFLDEYGRSDVNGASIMFGIIVGGSGCFISWLTSVFMNAMGVIVIKLG